MSCMLTDHIYWNQNQTSPYNLTISHSRPTVLLTEIPRGNVGLYALPLLNRQSHTPKPCPPMVYFSDINISMNQLPYKYTKIVPKNKILI